MPTATITDWANGPMGPGWFIRFPAHVDIFYDGGGMWDLLPDVPKTKEQEKRFTEIIALILLMRAQHECC